GKLLSESEFLHYSAKDHAYFDGFRSRNRLTFQNGSQWEAARRIAKEEWFARDDVCSSAVAQILSQGLPRDKGVLSPDAFMNEKFFKHVGTKAFSIAEAAREADRRPLN